MGEVDDRAGLERSVGQMNGKLDLLIDRVQVIDDRVRVMEAQLARIDEKLEHKASAADVAGIRGRVEALPTTWQMITLVFGILGGAFVILRFGLPHTP